MHIPESELLERAQWDDFKRFIAKRNLDAKAQEIDEQRAHMKKLKLGSKQPTAS